MKVLLIHADLLPPFAHAIPEGVTLVLVETPPEIIAAYGLADVAPPAGAKTPCAPRCARP
ncbi:hypothetical protein [Camelimonas lactis]|uniref:Uncharacterized protein n=1 Tax=Camelimonas lactis TaxID=659006 RepID=A0A4R2GQA7_9HYPH|nr:hypothetical protein [Camelimonas lactis]TCO11754.1 hypothetical protein EV666_11128 [Camelimonas lactis]